MTKVTRIAMLVVISLPTPILAQQAPVAKATAVRGIPCTPVASAAVDQPMLDHSAHDASQESCAGPLPTMSGQASFAAIGEIVRLLRANPNTDWTKVNLEALRLHFIDMDDVLMRSTVVQKSIPGGIEIEVTGTGATVLAIRRMATSHTRSLGKGPEYDAWSREIHNGARLSIAAKDPSNATLVAMIRALGFAGMMTEGDHHVRHHLALARGDAAPHK